MDISRYRLSDKLIRVWGSGIYLRVKQDIEELVNSEIERMMGDPGLEGLVVRKGRG